MKKLLSFVFLLPLFFSCCETDCCRELPIFEPIKVTHDIIFLNNYNDNGLYAIDTSTDKFIYKYYFGKDKLYYPQYESIYSKKVFFRLNEDPYLYILNPSTGKISGLKIDYPMSDLVMMDYKVQIVRNSISFKGVSVNCSLYNPITDSLEDFTILEGNLGSPIDTTIKQDNKSYLPIFYMSKGEEDNKHPTIYNITDNKILNFYPERNYTFFHFVGDKYLYAYHEETYFTDVYEVSSFEPVNAKIIFDYPHEERGVIGLRIFEDEDYLYVFDQPVGIQQITKRSKTDYRIIKQKTIDDYHAGSIPYFKNDYFWFIAPNQNGAYKISKDLEITVVK